MRAIFFFVFFFMTLRLQSNEWSSSATFVGQSYPSSSNVELMVGRSTKIWENPEYPLTYGLLSEKIKFNSSLFVNSLYGELEFFPLPFIALYGGGGLSQSQMNEKINRWCLNHVCEGRFYSYYWGVQLRGALEQFFLVSDYYIQSIKAKNGKARFINHDTYLEGHQGRDRLQQLQILIGYNIDDRWSVALLENRFWMDFSRDRMEWLMAYMAYRTQPWTFSLTGGEVLTESRGNHLSFMFSAQWSNGITF